MTAPARTLARLIVIDDRDTVGIVTAPVRPGDIAVATDGQELAVIAKIPRGHKVALRDHAAGEPVIKYGARIGVASAAIVRGEYVHSHNLVTVRGRRAPAGEPPGSS